MVWESLDGFDVELTRLLGQKGFLLPRNRACGFSVRSQKARTHLEVAGVLKGFGSAEGKCWWEVCVPGNG